MLVASGSGRLGWLGGGAATGARPQARVHEAAQATRTGIRVIDADTLSRIGAGTAVTAPASPAHVRQRRIRIIAPASLAQRYLGFSADGGVATSAGIAGSSLMSGSATISMRRFF